VYAIILSGGSGSRMGLQLPKQFLPLGDKPVIRYATDLFLSITEIDKVVVVSNPSFIKETRELFTDPRIQFVMGGETRHDSFLQSLHGLEIKNEDIFFIHDAARPFVSRQEILNLLAETKESAITTLAQKVTDTIVFAENYKVKEIRNRDKKFLIKTPQAIRGKELKYLLSLDKKQEPTDLCSWALSGGLETILLEANPYNLKITHKEDLSIAEAFLPLFKKIDQQGIPEKLR